jgi:hypothetical protein
LSIRPTAPLLIARELPDDIERLNPLFEEARDLQRLLFQLVVTFVDVGEWVPGAPTGGGKQPGPFSVHSDLNEKLALRPATLYIPERKLS